MSGANDSSDRGATEMTDDANVRRTREKVLSGELPKMDCRMTWYGPGRDGKCMAGDQPIGAHEVEVECDLPNGGTIRFHQRCYTIWAEVWPSCGTAQ